jgi:hypothetical protein
MAHCKLSTTLVSLIKHLGQMEQFAAAAQQWVSIPIPRGVPKFTVPHMEMVTEMAFLRAFSAWEAFLEESFILYLWGKDPPRGQAPKRYAYPPTRRVTEQIVVIEGRDYADWSNVHNVIGRAERFFENGKPYSDALKSQHSKLQDIQTIRNAIAHSSAYSWERFQRLIRRELGTYPPNLTIGGFLAMTIPHSSPPRSYLEFYLSVIQLVADRIVPS